MRGDALRGFGPQPLSTTIIIPAYNEAPRLAAVLGPLVTGAPSWDVILVNDGSSDATSEVARAFPGVLTVDLPVNRGKGAALWAGASRSTADVLMFLDADLRGLEGRHVEDLLQPVRSGQAEMTVGIFSGGREATDFSHRVTPWVSGQRAILRRTFLAARGVPEARHGIEALLTRAARAEGWRVRRVPWAGVTHAMQEEKLGFLRGTGARLRMYGEIFRGLTGIPANATARPGHRLEERRWEDLLATGADRTNE